MILPGDLRSRPPTLVANGVRRCEAILIECRFPEYQVPVPAARASFLDATVPPHDFLRGSAHGPSSALATLFSCAVSRLASRGREG